LRNKVGCLVLTWDTYWASFCEHLLYVFMTPGGFFWTLLFVQPELVMRNF